MNALERCAASFGNQPADRPAVYAFISHAGLVHHVTGEHLEVANAERLLATTYAACADATRQLLDDMLIVYADDEQVVDEQGYVYRRRPFHQWLEARPWSDTEGMATLMRRQIDAMLAWEPPGRDADPHRQRYAHLDDVTGGQVMLMGRAYVGTAPGSFNRDGLEAWSYLLADQRAIARDWVTARHRMNLRRIAAYADAARCPIEHMDGDIAGTTGLFVSPSWLAEVRWFDRLGELADAYHRAGVRVVFHSDGDLRPILADLAATGIDGLNPIDTSAGLTLREVRQRVGPDLLLVGGLDTRVLMHGSQDDVRSYVREQMALMAGTPWWAATSSEEWDASMPLNNVLAMLETLGTRATP